MDFRKVVKSIREGFEFQGIEESLRGLKGAARGFFGVLVELWKTFRGLSKRFKAIQ